MITLLAY